MYKIGEFIVYGNEGVCEVEEIKKMDIPGINESKKYYTLKPMHDNGKIFAPVDTSVFMRNIITEEEIHELIKQIPLIKETESSLSNARMLQEHYKKLINSHECIDLLSVIVNLNNKKADLIKNGKKLGQMEEKFMRVAKNLIEDEFSIVLGISKEDVEDYISNQVSKIV